MNYVLAHVLAGRGWLAAGSGSRRYYQVATSQVLHCLKCEGLVGRIGVTAILLYTAIN